MRRPRRLPFVLAAVSIVLTVVGAAIMLLNGQPLLGTFNLALIVVGTVYAVVGAFLSVRVPDNRISWLFLAAAVVWSLDFLLKELASPGTVTAPGSVPDAELAAWLSAWLWVVGNPLMLFAVPVLFPDGHLPSRRWRPIVAIAVILVLDDVVGHAAAAWPLRGDAAALVSFDASTASGLVGPIVVVGDLSLFLVLPITAAVSLVARYRLSMGTARLQIRWFTLAIVAMILLVSGDVIVSQISPAAVGLLSAIGLALIPLAIGTAILRYRLWEIDRIVSRTIGWILVTGILASMFVAAIVGLEALLSPVTSSNTLAVAGSTLVAAALFQPIRSRVQRAVDRRFNRSRVDAESVVGAFAARTRDEVDLSRLRAFVESSAHQTVSPTVAGVWLRSGPARNDPGTSDRHRSQSHTAGGASRELVDGEHLRGRRPA